MSTKPVSKSPEYIGLSQMAQFFGFLSVRLGAVAHRLNFMRYQMEFGQLDDDIYLVTFPKSGTTMMQVILYQLCTNGTGSMDFNHIYDVSPWISNDALRGRPPRVLPSPRIIKSHDPYGRFEKNTKGRFIYVYRDGMDVLVSLYHQNKNYNKPDLAFDDFFARFVSQKRDSWFHHVKEWFANRHGFPVLWLRYEDLVTDKRSEIGKIVEFLGLDVTNEAISKALEYSSFGYMKAHETKFGVQPPDLSERIFDQFIRKGETGEGESTLSPDQKRAFADRQRHILGKLSESLGLCGEKRDVETAAATTTTTEH
ncbi:MAG: sulfotransferase domain-containing protein [Spirochaetia bacterium]